MAQIDWRFMQPLDQSNQIAAMASGNQQINAGLAAMGGAVTGYADALKQRNTDSILNALYQAQTSADLPNALSAVQALQQQYGRGYDQAAVRNAIDTRGATLGQRDLQAINLQQAQAAQAAIPQLQALNIERMRAAGASPEQIAAAQGIQGIDTTALTSSFINDLQSDRTYSRNVFESDRNFKRLQQRDAQSDLESNRSYNLQLQNSAIQGAQYLAPEAGSSKQMIDANGNIINVAQPSRSDALAAGYALQGGYVDKVVGVESGGNPTAKNPNSTATGAGQFIESTWLSMMGKYRPDLIKGKTEAQILALRNNPELSKAMTAKYAEENGAALKKANLPVNDGTLYLAHFAGSGGAQKLLKANPNASAESILGSEAAAANGNIIKGKTAGQVISWAAKQVGGNNTASTASAAGISPNDLTSIRTLYNKGINKATADYQALTAKQNSKGSVAAGGTGVDTWLTNKKEFSLFGGSSNPISTDAHDLLKMAKEDKDWSNLPETAKVNILESAYGFVNSTGLTEYVPNQSVRNFINNRTKEYRANEANTYKNNKDAAFNTAYTALQEKFQLAGATPPTVEQARVLLGIAPPQQPNKQQAPKAQPVPTATSPTKAATTVPVKASNEKAASKASTPKPDKQAIVDFMVKKGTNLYPDGLDGVKDKTLIREAATEARKIIEADKVKAQQAEKAKEETRKEQSLAEIDRLKKAYADKQAAKIAAERKKQEEQRKLWEQKKLEEQQKLSKLFSPRV